MQQKSIQSSHLRLNQAVILSRGGCPVHVPNLRQVDVAVAEYDVNLDIIQDSSPTLIAYTGLVICNYVCLLLMKAAKMQPRVFTIIIMGVVSLLLFASSLHRRNIGRAAVMVPGAKPDTSVVSLGEPSSAQ